MDYDQIRASGLSDHDIRSIAADNDVRLSYLDPLTSWVPDGLPVDEDLAIVPYLDRSQDQFLRIAEALRVDKIHLIGSSGPAATPSTNSRTITRRCAIGPPRTA